MPTSDMVLSLREDATLFRLLIEPDYAHARLAQRQAWLLFRVSISGGATLSRPSILASRIAIALPSEAPCFVSRTTNTLVHRRRWYAVATALRPSPTLRLFPALGVAVSEGS